MNQDVAVLVPMAIEDEGAQDEPQEVEPDDALADLLQLNDRPRRRCRKAPALALKDQPHGGDQPSAAEETLESIKNTITGDDLDALLAWLGEDEDPGAGSSTDGNKTAGSKKTAGPAAPAGAGSRTGGPAAPPVAAGAGGAGGGAGGAGGGASGAGGGAAGDTGGGADTAATEDRLDGFLRDHDMRHTTGKKYPRSLYCSSTDAWVCVIHKVWGRTLKVTCKQHADCTLMVEPWWYPDAELECYRWASIGKMSPRTEHQIDRVRVLAKAKK